VRLKGLYTPDHLGISFELFPPKKWEGMAHLFEHFQELASCSPSFVTCTYGAGGATRERTLEVLDWIRGDYPQIPVAAHLTCVGSTREELLEYIQKALEQGVQGIVALRGDPPRGETVYTPVPGGLNHADELVALIREVSPEMMVLVAGYPEKHPEAASIDEDLDYLRHKVDTGADGVLSQLFYDNEVFFRFRDRCDRAGIRVPIVPGILPVTNLAQVKRITSLCGTKLTRRLLERLEVYSEDEEGQFSVGVYYAARQVEELIEAGAPGIHFYALNNSRATALICRALTLSRLKPGQSALS
jgi:methylenetetrahydrofolate reductase (NADPH)